MPQPQYGISLSGIGNRAQIEALAPVIRQAPEGCVITLGFSTCFALEDEMELSSRSGLFVPFVYIRDLLAPVAGVEYLAHLTQSIKVRQTLAFQIADLYFMAAGALSGVQINSPSSLRREDVELVGLEHLGKHLVFPLGRKTMRSVIAEDKYAVEEPQIINRLVEYLQNGVDTLLLDNSSGLGTPLSIDELEACLRILTQPRWQAPHIRIAGRLGKMGIEVPKEIKRRMPELSFSWEVESRLRDSTDQFSVEAAMEFLQRSYEVAMN